VDIVLIKGFSENKVVWISIGMEEKPHYFSYLLRVWLAGDGCQPQWRASLEDSRTGERIGFASLAAMGEYLEQQTRLDNRPREAKQDK
jgi:hypothetical protein